MEEKNTMEEWNNNDTNTDGMEFQDLNDDQSSIRQVVLAVLLGVLILANIVLVVFYFALGDDVFSGKGTTESTAPATSSEAEQETQPSSEAESETETVAVSSEVAQSSEASSVAASSSAAETKAESSAAASSEAQSSAAASSSAANTTTQTGNTQEAFGVVFDMIEPVSVTAKIHTNIRSYPGVRSDDDLLGAIDHGEWVTKIGVGRNGWSMVEYNGTVGYAVDSYLTTDTNWMQ